MDKVLQQINQVHGVIGSLVCNNEGEVLSNEFPPIFDTHILQNAAGLSVDFVAGLSDYTGGVELIDLPCSEGRIIIKNIPNGFLLLLCAGAFNMQMLNISLNVAVGKLNASLATKSHPPLSLAQPDADQLALAQKDQVSGESPLRLTVANLANKGASGSFDSLGMIAVSRSAAKYISEVYKTEFKKLALFNAHANIHGVFPVMIINDLGSLFDTSIVVGPGVGKKLKVEKGDVLEVKIG